jgi:hypothetical protein
LMPHFKRAFPIGTVALKGRPQISRILNTFVENQASRPNQALSGPTWLHGLG